MHLQIVHATEADIPTMMAIYDTARTYMRATGNHDQWTGGYPSEAIVRADIAANASYLIQAEKETVGVFSFFIGNEPTYQQIYEGNWHSDAPYGYIHRIASSGKVSGIGKIAFDFALSCVSYLRIDTHKDNRPMQTALTRYGFSYCGIIYLENGDPRVAFDCSVK